MKEKDVRITDNIICYERRGIMWATRAFWLFRVFGAHNVFIL
jgi:3-mercaptopyruvate sulfurtransferase SseA